jgi:hypothetical protein
VPEPYKMCEPHFLPSTGPRRCVICFPGTTNPEPVQSVNNPPSVPPQVGQPVLPTVAPAPTPSVSDPAAQKIIDAAKEYAEAVQAMTVTAEHLREAKETVAALESKLTDLKKTAQERLQITMEASK